MKLTILALTMLSSVAVAANPPTARQAVDVAKKRMSPVSQDQVLRIEGRRSDPELRIRRWDITFYDDTRVNNAIAVRVDDGQDTETQVQLRMFENASWDHFDRNFTGFSRKEVIDPARWKVDSDNAVSKVLKQPR